MDHFGLLEILARRSGAEVAALDCSAPTSRTSARSADRRRRVRAGDHAPPRRPRRPGHRAAGRSAAAFRAFGSSGQVTRPLRDGERARAARPDARGAAPARAQPLGHGLLGRASGEILLAGDHLLAHISSNPLISRPLRWPPADASAPPAAGAAAVHGLAASRRARCPRGSCCPATATPFIDHVALIDERLRMHAGARARSVGCSTAGRSDARTRSPGDVGQRRGHPGLPDAVGGARPRRPAGRGGPGGRATTRDGLSRFEATEL